MAADPTAVEAEAISFIFDFAFWILTTVVAAVVVYIWSQSKEIKELRDEMGKMHTKLALNNSNYEHLDEKITELKALMVGMDEKIDKINNK